MLCLNESRRTGRARCSHPPGNTRWWPRRSRSWTRIYLLHRRRRRTACLGERATDPAHSRSRCSTPRRRRRSTIRRAPRKHWDERSGLPRSDRSCTGCRRRIRRCRYTRHNHRRWVGTRSRRCSGRSTARSDRRPRHNGLPCSRTRPRTEYRGSRRGSRPDSIFARCCNRETRIDRSHRSAWCTDWCWCSRWGPCTAPPADNRARSYRSRCSRTSLRRRHERSPWWCTGRPCNRHDRRSRKQRSTRRKSRSDCRQRDNS